MGGCVDPFRVDLVLGFDADCVADQHALVEAAPEDEDEADELLEGAVTELAFGEFRVQKADQLLVAGLELVVAGVHLAEGGVREGLEQSFRCVGDLHQAGPVAPGYGCSWE